MFSQDAFRAQPGAGRVIGALMFSLTAFLARETQSQVITVEIGNPGNADDFVVMGDGTTGYGGVAYAFEIGVTEVTNAQYTAFLNAIAASDPNDLYHESMGQAFNGGIEQAGAQGNFSYSVIRGFENRPVIYVNFYDAIRFANWLHNGEPIGAQDNSTTEEGAYTLLGLTVVAAGDIDGNGRNSGWLWAVPTEDEWHKSAYGNSGDTYTVYATSSNDTPTAAAPPGQPNSANYDGAVPALTDGGAYVTSASFWGTSDQNGNLGEWNEGAFFIDSIRRRIRGGSWDDGSNALPSNERGGSSDGQNEGNEIGFRVVKRSPADAIGACCLPDATCMDDMDEAECATLGGTFQGVDTSCARVICAVGACCLGDGSCLDGVTELDCEALSGFYQGNGVRCGAVQCDPIGPVLYVDGGAAGGGDGSSWPDALVDLQDALDLAAAFPGNVDEIWVAAGAYTPDRGTLNWFISFQLVSDVAVYGGFVGDEKNLADRDFIVNVTILSGDLQGLGPAGGGVQSLNVVDATGADATARLDGFTITAGNASGVGGRSDGGGLFNFLGSPTVVNCTFLSNMATDRGGAVFSEGGAPTFVDCTFAQNLTDSPANNTEGGAAYILTGNANFIDCMFDANSADDAAAVYVDNADVLIDGCVFTNNIALDDTGAVFCGQGAQVITDCHFENNEGFSAGALFLSDSDAVVTTCTFIANTASEAGGAVKTAGGAPLFDLCTFSGNLAGIGGALSTAGGAPASFMNCLFDSNISSGKGGAVHIVSTETVLFESCMFDGNFAPEEGGAINALGTDITLSNCEMTGNESLLEGGGLIVDGATVTLQGGTFSGNIAPLGAGVSNRGGDVHGGALLLGADDFHNSGRVFPGLADAPLMIDGVYWHESASGNASALPSIVSELAGTVPGQDFGVLEAGTASLLGLLSVEFVDGFAPQAGDQFGVISTPSLGSHFGVAYVPGLPAGLTMFVDNDPLAGVTLQFADLNGLISYEQAVATPRLDQFLDAEPGDFDDDGDLDVAVLWDAGDSGFISILRNDGTDGKGNWNGFTLLPEMELAGDSPVRLAAGRFNPDQSLDLAVTDAVSQGLATFWNRADGTAQFDPGQTINIGAPQSRITAGPAAHADVDDLVVNLWFDTETMIYLRNNGNGVFVVRQTFDIFANSADNIELGDVNDDERADLVVLNGGILVFPYDDAAEMFGEWTAYEIEAGDSLHLADLNNDGSLDVVTVDRLTDVLSVLVNRADGSGDFDVSASILVDAAPAGVTTTDADADGDLDIVVTHRPFDQSPSTVSLLRNGLGDGDTVVLSTEQVLAQGDDLVFTMMGDHNGDGLADLIAAQSDGSLLPLLGVAFTCPSDLDGDGVVGADDVLALLGAWDTNPKGPPDLDGDGTVGTRDLLILLGNWGPCV